MIHICYSGNKRVFPGLLLSVLSVVRHTRRPVRVHVLSMDMREQDEAFVPFSQNQMQILDAVLKEKNPESALWKAAPSMEQVDGKTLFVALAAEDPAAKEVFEAYIAALGEGIANLVNILRPQAVILGGGISAEGERLLKPLREYVLPRLYVSELYAPIELLCAKLGNDAGLYGAAWYADSRL